MSDTEKNARNRALSESSDHLEDEITFEPIIKLPEVEVPTLEENEDVLLKLRAKLYRFDSSGPDGPEWKERGTGDVKLLEDKESHSIRVVMRREKTLKVCANHFITPWMDLKPSFGSDKAFVYTVAADFADETAKTECLAIRFGTLEAANLFKEKFNEAKRIVTTKCALYNTENGQEQSSSSSDSEESTEESDKIKEVTKKVAELDVSVGKESKSP